ncbi:sialin-like [Acropora muricata]|uniref:sialin-like n=1 Tax=Acropora muricata TaxID=159855 RepID=UPI0034E53B1E
MLWEYLLFYFGISMAESETILKTSSSSYRSRRAAECCIPCKCRYVLAALSCSGFCVIYLLRVNLSVALVAMVNSTYTNEKVSKSNPECQRNLSTSSLQKDEQFNWDEKTQGLILGSFFYGYILTQLPGGWLGARFGAKNLFGFGVLTTSVLTMLTPLAARHSVGTLIAVRILEGLGEGVTFPAMHAMWSSWAPPLERSKLITFSYAGLQLGTIIGMPLTGYLCSSSFWGGWPSVFYIFGAIGVIWFFIWMTFTYDRPSDHPRISIKEREYIESTIGEGQDKRQRVNDTPWFSIWTSLPVWGIIVAHFCNNWGFYTFLTCLPSYFKEVLNFPIFKDGFLSAIPFLCMYVFGISAGQVADWLRLNKIIPTGEVRKVFATGGFLVPACLMVSTSYVGCEDTTLAVLLFSLALGTSNFNAASFNVNHLDIAPRYAGVLMGITNTAGTIPGIVGPFVVGVLTNNEPTRAQWQKVFYISAGVYVLGWLTFMLLASGKQQSWNTPYENLFVPIEIPREPRKPIMASVLENGGYTSCNSDDGLATFDARANYRH